MKKYQIKYNNGETAIINACWIDWSGEREQWTYSTDNRTIKFLPRYVATIKEV